MSKIQWIAFRIIIQYLSIICGQVLGMADKAFGEVQFWKIFEEFNKFCSRHEPNMDVEE